MQTTDRLSQAKAGRLRALTTEAGIIAALAMDQRKSLRRMIASACGVSEGYIDDRRLAEFKAAVTGRLSPYASAVLLDPEFGLEAANERTSSCGLLLTYEDDGYDNPRPHRMLALMPRFSVRRLRDLGAAGIKILLSYTPFDDDRANEEKRIMVERIGCECHALDMPFFLEPVGYDPGGLDPNGPEYARMKPEIVIRSMEEFSKPQYRVDVLKVEFPVNVAFTDGRVYTRRQALEYFRHADAVARVPYIYLSAGASSSDFLELLRMAAEAGARYSGVLCGRATWQDGVGAYARGGIAALREWLETEGVRNIRAVNECLRSAVPAIQRL